MLYNLNFAAIMVFKADANERAPAVQLNPCQVARNRELKMIKKVAEFIAALFIGAWLYVLLVFIMSI